MTNLDRPARLRLASALASVADTFRGMTAHPDEYNCECHWGSAEELSQLKAPDVELDPDLLRRTWQAPDWQDHASVLRRILPQFATTLVSDRISTFAALEDVGRSFARGRWQQWPAEQAAAVQEFLDAWWTHTLTDPDPAVPAYEVLPVVAEASATLSPWLTTWESLTDPFADRHLAEALTRWDYDLLGDRLPWNTWEDEEGKRLELTGWLVRYAPARLQLLGRPPGTAAPDTAAWPRRPRPLGRPALARLHLLTGPTLLHPQLGEHSTENLAMGVTHVPRLICHGRPETRHRRQPVGPNVPMT